jgi:hypothetical protein
MKLAPISARVLPASAHCIARARCIAQVKFVALPLPFEPGVALRGRRAAGGRWARVSRMFCRALGLLVAARP